MAELDLDADATPNQVVDRALKADRATTVDAAPSDVAPSADQTPSNRIGDAFGAVSGQPQADVSGDPDVQKALSSLGGPVMGSFQSSDLIPTHTVNQIEADDAQAKKTNASDLIRGALPRQTPPPMPQAEQTPGNIMRGAIGAFSNPLMWLAIAGSTMTRRPAINALTAATGVLTGLNENDYRRAYLNTHKFRNSVKESAVQIANENAAYAAIFNDTKMSSADKIANLAGLAGSFDDKPMQQFLKQGNLGAAQQLWEGRKHIAEHTSRAVKNYDEKQGQLASADEQRQAEAIYRYAEPPLTSAPRNKAEAAHNQRVMGMVRRLGEQAGEPYSALEWEKRKSGEKAGATAEARRDVKTEQKLEDIPPVLRNQVKDYYPPDLDLKELIGIKGNEAARLESAVNTSSNLEDIAAYAVAHPEALGWLAELQKNLNVDKLHGMSPTNPNDLAQTNNAVDRQIDSMSGGRNIPGSAAAKVLAKMLTTQAFNDAAMAGARGATIYLDKAFRDIYQQASSPDAFFNILNQRYINADLELSNHHMGMRLRNDLSPNSTSDDPLRRRGHPFFNRGPDAYVRDFNNMRELLKTHPRIQKQDGFIYELQPDGTYK